MHSSRQTVLLKVNGASDRHRAAVLSDDGQMGRPVVVRDEVLWVVVAVRVRGVVCDPAPNAIAKVDRRHVVDQLRRT